MKITGIILLFIATGMWLGFRLSEDFLQTLNISREDAENSVWYSFSSGNLNYPVSDIYKSLSGTARTALAKEIGVFAKAYTQTDDFKSKYLEMKESRKPKEPDPFQTTQAMKDQYKQQIQKSITEIEANLPNLSGDVKTAMEGAISTMKEQMKQIDDPNNLMFSKDAENARMEYYHGQQEEYKKSLAEWQSQFPESPVNMIKDQLNHFLQVSSTVDFSAKLQKNEYGSMVFVNPDYEDKPSEWKLIYRAGKEGTDAARQVATQWLSELK